MLAHAEGVRQELKDIRITPEAALTMARLVLDDCVGEQPSHRLLHRLENDRSFELGVIRVVQDVVVSTTMAQALSTGVDFNVAIHGRKFAGGDGDLVVIGQAVLGRIQDSARLEDRDIPASILNARYASIKNALIGG